MRAWGGVPRLPPRKYPSCTSDYLYLFYLGGLRKLQFLLEGADESKFTQVTRGTPGTPGTFGILGTPGTSVEQEDDSGVDSSQNSR